MKNDKIPQMMEEIISSNPKSKVYSATDFNTLENNIAVRQALVRLEKKQELTRVARGFYKPKEYSRFLKEEVAVNPDEFARAYANAYGWTIAPCGDTALNLLNISTQVPNTYKYISDGPYKTIALNDGRIIEFKHKAVREISGRTYNAALLMEALNTLGKDKISASVRKQIKNKFKAEELELIKQEAVQSRDWLYDEICKLTEDENV
ncbi:MAG: hypothetical protein EOM59_09350 [Clostridia bacterium]|nr:hypothetical protein [Clostridia bacterium]